MAKNQVPIARRSKKFVDPDDAPPLDAEFFKRGEIRDGDRVIRPGRPPLLSPKVMISVRLDADVVRGLRESGAGWQSRLNDTLRRSLARQPTKRFGRKG
jgi:uncharacterized protein (DUF4415 family)